jgi:hypothetical protein
MLQNFIGDEKQKRSRLEAFKLAIEEVRMQRVQALVCSSLYSDNGQRLLPYPRNTRISTQTFVLGLMIGLMVNRAVEIVILAELGSLSYLRVNLDELPHTW